MAGTTGLEPATSAVTGQRSNQLSYVPRVGLWYQTARRHSAQLLHNLLMVAAPDVRVNWLPGARPVGPLFGVGP